MKRGKQTCKILKDIRRQIAEANDIEFITSECQYQGDCLGTCPKCEAEVRYLEQQLERKRMAGKAITILGISAGLVAMAPMAAVMPEFPGGARELMKFISANIRYPSMSQGGVCQGRAIVQFIVDKEGNIVQPKVVRGVDPYLDKEALRVVGLMPKWKPGELDDGTKVAVRFTIPVMFRLQ